VDYTVTTPAPGVVEAVSRVRLPFEPAGWLAEFRRDLREACGGLVAAPGRILHGVYSSADRSLADLENVLCYNVGPGSMSAGAGGFVLERSFVPSTDAPHHYRYEMIAGGMPWSHWRATDVLATVQVDADRSLFTDPKTGRWWLAARRGTVTAHSSRDLPPVAYALTVTISPPPAWRGSVVNLVKPLADGIVSALHNPIGPVEHLVDRAAHVDPTLTSNEFAGLLTERRPAPLGRVGLIVARGAGVQWLPADDAIVALDVRIVRSTPGAVHAVVHLVAPV
jgi:hypothetical protein